MWPILMQFLRSNAPILTLPFAAVIGVIGYNLEGYFSDRYTPYNTTFMLMGPKERTFIMIKPDGVQRGYVGTIIERFERKGLKLIALKLTQPSEALLKKHYRDLVTKPFFTDVLKYISSGPVVPMVWEGLNAVKAGRQMLGATNPSDSQPGTIRGDVCIEVGRNIIHGSDSFESANREISLWFSEKELIQWTSDLEDWVYE